MEKDYGIERHCHCRIPAPLLPDPDKTLGDKPQIRQRKKGLYRRDIKQGWSTRVRRLFNDARNRYGDAQRIGIRRRGVDGLAYRQHYRTRPAIAVFGNWHTRTVLRH